MGTRIGSETKVPSKSIPRKHKQFPHPKESISTVRNRDTRSPNFTRSADVANVVEGREDWEDQFCVTFSVNGKSNEQVSQPLPDRSENACQQRRAYEPHAQTQQSGTQERDALAIHTPNKEHGRKLWEEWEDQILMANRKAGQSFTAISKLLSSRTKSAAARRLDYLLKLQNKDTIPPPSIVRPYQRWTLEEKQLLNSLYESGKRWDEIAKYFPTRDAKACSKRWCKLLHTVQPSSQKSRREWKEWEERLLVSGYYAGLSWEEIAQPITGRTVAGVKAHWFKFLRSPDQNKPWTSEELASFTQQDKPWTSEEIAVLTQLRAEGNDWDDISQKVPGHPSNACRTQWYKETEGIGGKQRIHGSSHPGRWSAEEVDTLVTLFNTIGPRWEEICKYFPGRTACACYATFNKKSKTVDGVGAAAFAYRREYLDSKSRPRNCLLRIEFQADSVRRARRQRRR